MIPINPSGWVEPANLTSGRLFRRVHNWKGLGEALKEKAVWHVAREYAAKSGIDKLAPHGLRRTCARLCHSAEGELQQTQFLPGQLQFRKPNDISPANGGFKPPPSTTEWESSRQTEPPFSLSDLLTMHPIPQLTGRAGRELRMPLLATYMRSGMRADVYENDPVAWGQLGAQHRDDRRCRRPRGMFKNLSSCRADPLCRPRQSGDEPLFEDCLFIHLDFLSTIRVVRSCQAPSDEAEQSKHNSQEPTCLKVKSHCGSRRSA